MSTERCKEIATRRFADLGLPKHILAEIKYGDTSGTFTSKDHLGCVLQKGDEKLWMIVISDQTPEELLEEVVTHEVCHILYQYSDEGDGEENLVDLLAKCLVRLST